MKILHITKYFLNSNGGIEYLTKSHSLAFKNYYRKIDILCFSKTKILKKRRYKRLNIIQCNTDLNIKSTPFSFQMFKFLKENINNYDAINVYLPNPYALILILFLKSKKIKIYATWGSDIINQKILKKIFYFPQYLFLKKCKKIICLSKQYIKYSNELKNFIKKIVIIPPLINQKFKRIILKKPNKQKLIITTVGRLVDYKNHQILIKAAEELPKNIFINIIGNGPKYKYLTKLIEKKNLHSQVKIFKNINDNSKIKILQKSDIFCFTSKSRAESFGIALLEALSIGLPLIVSNNKGSGMMEMIKHRHNGLIFQNNDKDDLKDKIYYLNNNKKLLKEFSKNSLELYEKKFNPKKFIPKFKNFYK